MLKAFLSHSSAQKTFVEKVAQILGQDNCFLDNKTFESGMQTIEEIIKAIGKSSIFVFFISKEALESEWVKDELSNVREYVDDGVIRFLPIILNGIGTLQSHSILDKITIGIIYAIYNIFIRTNILRIF